MDKSIADPSAILDALRNNQLQKHGSGVADGLVSNAPGGRWIFEKVVGQLRMEIEDGHAIEANVVHRLHQKFDGAFVVEDHLSVLRAFAGSNFTLFDQSLCLQQRVGIALQTARIPGEIDQEALQNLLRVRASGLYATLKSRSLQAREPLT